MTTTPELDRAIVVALEAHKMSPSALNDQMRGFVRNIVAELLRGMEPPLDPPAILGWDLAIKVIKRRAGLEGEG